MIVSKDKLKIQPQVAVLARYKARNKDDLLGFEVNEYLAYLNYDKAQEFLKEEFRDDAETRDEWTKIPSLEEALAGMKDYMSFAWDKANGFRGISADRSIRHYVAWTWIISDEQFSDEVDLAQYEFYGKDILVKICERYGWDHNEWDDGVRLNDEPRV